MNELEKLGIKPSKITTARWWIRAKYVRAKYLLLEYYPAWIGGNLTEDGNIRDKRIKFE